MPVHECQSLLRIEEHFFPPSETVIYVTRGSRLFQGLNQTSRKHLHGLNYLLKVELRISRSL